MTAEQDTSRLDQPDEPVKSLGYNISGSGATHEVTEFQMRVIGILENSTEVYYDRSAVYKDNFRSVGRVMVALFPNGRPPLVTAADYDRWHIFELLIVKLTRYANNYDVPHEDSLIDMLPYIGILGALDQELREREASKAKHPSRKSGLVNIKHTAWPRHPAEYGAVPCSMCVGMVYRDKGDAEWGHAGEFADPQEMFD